MNNLTDTKIFQSFVVRPAARLADMMWGDAAARKLVVVRDHIKYASLCVIGIGGSLAVPAAAILYSGRLAQTAVHQTVEHISAMAHHPVITNEASGLAWVAGVSGSSYLINKFELREKAQPFLQKAAEKSLKAWDYIFQNITQHVRYQSQPEF